MMIIFNAVICHVPTIVLAAGANISNLKVFVLGYSIYERVQVTIFFIQEVTISGLYISETVKLLRPGGNIQLKRARRVMSNLIFVNIIIIMLDITILALEYLGLYNIQTSYKAFAYSIKLKLEFSILNRLVEFTQSRRVGTLSTFDLGSGKGVTQSSTIATVEEHATVTSGPTVIESSSRDDDASHQA
jgi:hypothetical protein